VQAEAGVENRPLHRRSIALRAGAAVMVSMALAAATACTAPAGRDRVDAASRASAPLLAAAPRVDLGATGRLESAIYLNRISAAEIASAITAAGRKAPAVTPRYDVDNHRLTYRTIDGRGRPITASGLVSVPVRAAGARSPVMSYQHGTLYKDAQAPSNHAVAKEPAVVMASVGYIVVAADYVGYGASIGATHPYLMAEPSAAAVLDLLTAARDWRRAEDIADNGQLFLTGYSEGGYVSLAAHRTMQATNSPHLQHLVATVAGGGPYHLGVTMTEQLRKVRQKRPIVGALFHPAVLELMGTSLRREARRLLVRNLVPRYADVRLQTRFMDHHFERDDAALDRSSNVHDWKPEVPVSLFHGRDDQTVPHASAVRTLEAMRARGATHVSLTDCPATPSSHRNCVKPYWDFMLGQLAGLARDR
jgi:pimeloyl-ACP methyl ester carboxylesterase